MLTTFYPPYNFGGDGIGIQRLSRALARRGHHVTVVHEVDAYNALHHGPEPAPQAEHAGVEVVGLRSGLGPISLLLTQQTGRPIVNAARLARILADGAFDVIHFNNVSLIGGPGILGMGGGVKVYEAHEHWLVCPAHVLWRYNREPCPERDCLRCVVSYRRPPQLWRYTGYLERQLAHVDAFIAKSEFSRDKHREFGFPRDMEVVPYFLPDEQESTGRSTHEPAPHASPLASARPHERPYFLFVGRLERIKGLSDVIPLFRDFDRADLLIAGDGDFGAELRRLASGIDRVRFLGRVPGDDLDRHYRHAEALIVPSTCFETFGIILIEAFREGIPVIARRMGPFPEVVETARGGLLFDTPAELLAAMHRMLDDREERARMSERARRAFARHWTDAVVVPQYLGVVRAAAERKGVRRVAEALCDAGQPRVEPAARAG
jgi:glycosyltransferase involved in cell wall biosynthesis